jgi:hypothetical protein
VEIPSLREQRIEAATLCKEVVAQEKVLQGDISQFGEVLREQPLELLISFIQRNTKLRHEIAEVRKQVLKVDSQLELMKIKVGDLKIDEVEQNLRAELEAIKQDFSRLEQHGKNLMDNCKEYEARASDEEEEEKILAAET